MNASTLTMSEAELQKAVIDTARMFGFKVAHFHDSRRQVKPGVFVGDKDAAGFPDLVLARHGRLIFAEFKTANGRVSPEQAGWINALRETGASVYVWRPEQWRDGTIEKVLR